MPDFREPHDVQPRWDPNRADFTWRLWVSNHPIAAAALSGFIATHIATIFAYFFGGISLPQLIWPIANGNVVLPHSSPATQFVIGEVFIHGMDGVVFTIIYAVALFPLSAPLFGRHVNAWTNMGKGILFGLILGTFSAGFLTPYVYEAGHHAGIFSTGLGWKVPVAIYLFHIVYGVNLGLMYNPLAKRAVRGQARRPEPRPPDRLTADISDGTDGADGGAPHEPAGARPDEPRPAELSGASAGR